MNRKSDLRFEPVIERFKTALGVENLGQVADIIGIKRNAFYNRKTSGSIPFEDIICVCLDRNISIDWVMAGEGKPFKDHDQWVAPVAEIDPHLLGEITAELWRAFDGEGDLELLATAHQRGGLAAHIFNKVAFVKSEKVRSGMIRDQAVMFADAAQWLGNN